MRAHGVARAAESVALGFALFRWDFGVSGVEKLGGVTQDVLELHDIGS